MCVTYALDLRSSLHFSLSFPKLHASISLSHSRLCLVCEVYVASLIESRVQIFNKLHSSDALTKCFFSQYELNESSSHFIDFLFSSGVELLLLVYSCCKIKLFFLGDFLK